MTNILVILDQPPRNKPKIESDSTSIKAIFAGSVDESSHDFTQLRGYTFDIIMVPKTITEDLPCYRPMWNYVRRMENGPYNTKVIEYEDSY